MNNGKNRQGLAAAAALAFGVLVLAVPEAAARGFAGGTALCLQSVLPALFPFFVVCELLTAAPPPAALLRPMQQVLGLASAETARALLLSWVGGYAVCARLAGQLYGAERITRRDAALLQVLGCCSGPGFVIGCVGGALLGNVRLGVVLYAAQIGANLGTGAVCQLLSHIVGVNIVRPLAVSDVGGLSGKAQPRQLDGRTMFAPTDCTREVSGRSKVLSPTRCGGSHLAEGAKGLPQAISSAVTSSLSVCGCVVFFRIVGAVLLAVLPLPPTAVSAALEVSAGCADFAALGGAAALYGCCACLSVLGVSVWAQLRLFAGAVMILLAFGPLARITGMETAIAGMFEKIIFEDDVRTLKEELGAVDERRIAGFYERYRAAVESDIRTMAESDGLECVSVSARVADAGNLSHVKLVVRGEQNQAGAEIASVRRKIGAYYGVEERDIEVDVERE